MFSWPMNTTQTIRNRLSQRQHRAVWCLMLAYNFQTIWIFYFQLLYPIMKYISGKYCFFNVFWKASVIFRSYRMFQEINRAPFGIKGNICWYYTNFLFSLGMETFCCMQIYLRVHCVLILEQYTPIITSKHHSTGGW